MPSARSPRPLTVRFPSDRAAEDLKPLAERKRVGFAWDASSYSALGRSLAPCPASLSAHGLVLEILAKWANTCFPSQTCLTDTIVILHKNHKILGADVSNAKLPREAARAADSWRILMKHCYELKKKGASVACLQHILDVIELPPAQPGAAGHEEERH